MKDRGLRDGDGPEGEIAALWVSASEQRTRGRDDINSQKAM
jgi:hypothetical protein